MKKHKGLIIAGVVLATLAVYCLWYTLVPKSWADVFKKGQISSLSVFVLYGDQSEDIHLEVHGGHPAAQAIISALEGHTYQADLANLSPIPRGSISVPGADALAFLAHTQDNRLEGFIIYSNGQFATELISTSWSCRSYKTDPELFQEVFGVFQKYATAQEK